MTRESQIKNFLQTNNLWQAERQQISGDASFRRYERLFDAGKSYILMDAPPTKEDVPSFINIATFLRRKGFSAPEIYANDLENGLLLIEDLGEDSYTALLSGRSRLSKKYTEEELYISAIEVLVQIGKLALPRKLPPPYSNEMMMKECQLLSDWYLPNVCPSHANDKVKTEYFAIWQELLNYKKICEDVLVLRDYHADNLLWLPDRVREKRIGLLDFQDAVIGSPIYDIVSLLEDARRDVSKEVVHNAIKFYLDSQNVIKKSEFMEVYNILAAQRNCKIIGIFSRLAVRDNKPNYLSFIPRVWGHLQSDIEHPTLKPLKKWLDENIPVDIRGVDSFKLPQVQGVTNG